MPRTYRFNHVVGIDLVQVTNNVTNAKEWWLNVVCWGTVFQQVWRVGESKDPETCWQAFVKCWIRFFGESEILVLDPGLEFSAYFAEMASARGVAVLQTDPRSPWQNGRTERIGGEWKRLFRKARRKDQPLTDGEFEAMGLECCSHRNRYFNRKALFSLVGSWLGEN